MIFERNQQGTIVTAAFSLAVILCFANGIFAQQSRRSSSATKSGSGVRLKKAMVIGRKNPVLVNPPARQLKNLVTLGIINGRATNLVVPQLNPTTAEIARIREILVQVIIDENGNVVWAQAAGKRNRFTNAAEKSALKSVFIPVVLSGRTIKVRGIISYKLLKS